MSEPRPCKKCRATIEMIENRASGKQIPAQKVRSVYILVEGKLTKLELGRDLYVSHFETCPDAGEFTKS